MKVSDLRNKNLTELKGERVSLLKELFKLKVQRKLGEAPRSHNFKLIKRNIARILTIITEKKKQRS